MHWRQPNHYIAVHERRWRSKRVEITNVSFWAFSEDSDKSVSLWASGRAGWFELHDPVPQYREIYDGMTEAVSMLYHLADKYKRSRKNATYLSLKEMNRHVRSVFRDVRIQDHCLRLLPQLTSVASTHRMILK